MSYKNVLSYLEYTAKEFGDKTAFADETASCTYRELQLQAKAAGTALCHLTGVRRPVAVFMEKSPKAVAAFMGVVYAGCFYVMLDIEQPTERLHMILDTLQAEVLITDEEYVKKAEMLEFKGEIVQISKLLETEADEELLLAVKKQATDIDPLYAIFTSGSTGVPKGVLVSHRSVIDFIDCFTELFSITSEDVIGNQAPFDFDVSVKDIYSALKTGATVQIIPRKMFSLPTALLDFLEERKVTTLIWAVSALCIITTLKGFSYKIPGALNKIMFSGEVMPMKHLQEWRKTYPDAMFVNLYGPTEITCNCTYYMIDREFGTEDVLPMGQAFPNEKVFLLDEEEKEIRKTEPGKTGELCVSGTCLALGYYGNKEKTEQAFVQNPLNPFYMETIYRTGDLAQYNERQELVFVSRKDFQIKHMGHRIELGEIEAAMGAMEQVERVCCIFHEPKKKIMAFYEGNADKKEITRGLMEKLPRFMIPNGFVKVEKMPLTKNGKIDRKKLTELYL